MILATMRIVTVGLGACAMSWRWVVFFAKAE
jgi:hypothetical protein